MLEIPESYNRGKELESVILGKRIINVEANVSPHGFAFYFGDPQEYQARLSEKKITGIKAVAGWIEIEVEEMRILFGDGVNIRFLEESESMPKKYQMSVEFEDESKIVCTVQMYGGLWAYKEGENDNYYYQVARSKPNPMEKEFDEAYFENLWTASSKKLSAKAFLATDQRIPGLGNGVLQDILINARVNPKTKLEFLDEKDKINLYRSIKETLLKMTTLGGRDTEKDIYGVTGGYQTILSKNTYKSPCPICGETIVKVAYLGGTVYYCPKCQPIKKQS